MIAPNHNRRADFTLRHHLVKTQSSLHAFAVTQPADAGRQPLELDLFSRQLQPTVEMFVFGEQFDDGAVGGINIFRVARKRHPPEWPFAFAEQRTNIGWHETGIIKSVLHAKVKSALT